MVDAQGRQELSVAHSDRGSTTVNTTRGRVGSEDAMA